MWERSTQHDRELRIQGFLNYQELWATVPFTHFHSNLKLNQPLKTLFTKK